MYVCIWLCIGGGKCVDIKVGGENEGIEIKVEQILMDLKSRNEGYKTILIPQRKKKQYLIN